MPDPAFVAGQHEALIKGLVADMAEVKGSVQRIELHLAEKRGERKAILWLGASSGGLVSAFVAVIARYFR